MERWSVQSPKKKLHVKKAVVGLRARKGLFVRKKGFTVPQLTKAILRWQKGLLLAMAAMALTSVLAIAALLVGRSYGWLWADPAMGVVGALVIARWSWGLIRDAGSVLLDAPAEGPQVRQEIEDILAATGDTLKDLHVWQIGPGHFAAIVSVASATPQPAQHYKALLLPVHELSHVTVEVQAL
jgi:Co/Zn/Cd efflux system component